MAARNIDSFGQCAQVNVYRTCLRVKPSKDHALPDWETLRRQRAAPLQGDPPPTQQVRGLAVTLAWASVPEQG